MAAQTYLNSFLQQARGSDDPAVMVALQNFCLDNLQRLIQIQTANKKAADQLRNINDFWFFAAIVAVISQELQFKIDRAYYLEDAHERRDLQDKLSEDAQKRLFEINLQYDQYIANQLIIQQRLNQENIDKTLKERANSVEKLQSLLAEVSVLNTELGVVNLAISTSFNKIISDLSSGLSYEYQIADKKIVISQEEVANEMDDEFGEELRNNTLKMEMFEDRVFNRFKVITDRKLSDVNLDPIQHAAESTNMARISADDYIAKFKSNENYLNLVENIESRNAIETKIETKELEIVERQQEIAAYDATLQDLGYDIELFEQKANNANHDYNSENVIEKVNSYSQMDINDDDPFGDDEDIVEENKRDNNDDPDNHSDNDYQPPPNPPENPGPNPNESPPIYQERRIDFPEPSAPSLNEIESPNLDAAPPINPAFPSPSAPSLEDLASPRPSAPELNEEKGVANEDYLNPPRTQAPNTSIPKEPPPQYQGNRTEMPENKSNNSNPSSREEKPLSNAISEEKAKAKPTTGGITAMLRKAAENNPQMKKNLSSSPVPSVDPEAKPQPENKTSSVDHKKPNNNPEPESKDVPDEEDNKPKGPRRR